MKESINLLKDYRFNISENSLELMKKERAYLQEQQKKIPELAGLTFFGSRTLGREKESSDLDMNVFYDSSDCWKEQDGELKPDQDKIAILDRNILRMGLFELLFVDRKEVPSKVAINEAIELGKAFGGDTSGKFINGVLGAVYKEIGEPGKEDESPNKKKKDIPFEEMKIEEKVGAVVFCEDDGQIYFGLVHDVFGHWTLSKGGLAEGEDDEAGLKRVIKEEMNLDLKNVKSLLGETEYVANHPEKGKHRKQVRYYLVQAEFGDIKLPEGKGGLDDAKWFKVKDVAELNFYNDIVPLITQSITSLMQEKVNA